jgi:hypothetical protein
MDAEERKSYIGLHCVRFKSTQTCGDAEAERLFGALYARFSKLHKAKHQPRIEEEDEVTISATHSSAEWVTAMEFVVNELLSHGEETQLLDDEPERRKDILRCA